MEINETYKLTINGYDMNGYGVAKLDNRVIFVEKAMDGEVVIAKITNVHKKYAFAVMIKLLSPSKNRIEPLCPYSQLCGGCDLLHIDYETETALIDDELLDSFDILQIISAIDDEFDVAIPAAMIVPQNFNSVEALWNMIQELME